MTKRTKKQELVLSSVVILCIVVPFALRQILPNSLRMALSVEATMGMSCFLLSLVMLTLMYVGLAGESRGSRLCYGVLLVLASSMMYASLEALRTDTAGTRSLSSDARELANYLLAISSLAKDVVAFGFAAIGGNVIASTLLQRES